MVGGALDPPGDEAQLTQLGEVMGDRGGLEVQERGQLAARGLSGGQDADDAQAGLVGEGLEEGDEEREVVGPGGLDDLMIV